MHIRKFQAVKNGRTLSETMAAAIANHVELLDEEGSEAARKESSRLSILLTVWDDAQEEMFD